jgi:site-specific DNA-methyltransferase (adenine-specific)
MAWGVGGLNIDGTRIEGSWTTWRKKDGTVSEQNQDSHTIYGADMGAMRKPEHPSGRWPANVILDEDAAVALDAQSGVTKGSGIPRRGIVGGHKFGGEKGQNDTLTGQWHNDSGGASRFFYTAKASKAEREAGLDAPIGERANIHTTVKPLSLMRYLVRLVTPKHGKVLDPFMGSGSTGCAAVLEGFDFVGIDITPEYVAIAQKRIDHYAVTSPLEGLL